MQFNRKILFSLLCLFATSALLVAFGNFPVKTKASTLPPAPETDIKSASGALSIFGDSKELFLAFPSVYSGVVGSGLTLTGSGFSLKSNTVNFGKTRKIKNIVAKSANEITFVIPDVPAGRYDISVSSEGKNSDAVPFMVTVPGSAPPAIEAIKPNSAKFGEEIKIIGKNFAPSGNIVSSNWGVIKNLKSKDGKTLSFVIPLPEYLENDNPQLQKTWFNGEDNLYWPTVARVVNEYGVSEYAESSKFILNI